MRDQPGGVLHAMARPTSKGDHGRQHQHDEQQPNGPMRFAALDVAKDRSDRSMDAVGCLETSTVSTAPSTASAALLLFACAMFRSIYTVIPATIASSRSSYSIPASRNRTAGMQRRAIRHAFFS